MPFWCLNYTLKCCLQTSWYLCSSTSGTWLCLYQCNQSKDVSSQWRDASLFRRQYPWVVLMGCASSTITFPVSCLLVRQPSPSMALPLLQSGSIPVAQHLAWCPGSALSDFSCKLLQRNGTGGPVLGWVSNPIFHVCVVNSQGNGDLSLPVMAQYRCNHCFLNSIVLTRL